jgi:ZIP family zinc transporter
LAIVIDNLSEALSIGEFIRGEEGVSTRAPVRRVLGWTGLIGITLFISALAGWLFLRGLSASVLGFLFGVGSGGMFYLTVTDLVPEAEERQYQQSAALANAGGFMLMFVISQFL